MSTTTKPKRSRPKAPETKTPEKAANEHLQPVIDATKDIYGSRIRLMTMIGERIGRPISRHLAHRWFNDDPAKRQQPILGMGLIIREVFDANRETICQPWDGAERRPTKAKRTPQPRAA